MQRSASMTFFRRLFSFSIVQLIIEILFLSIVAGLLVFLVSLLHIPQLSTPDAGESFLVLVTAATFLLARFRLALACKVGATLSERYLDKGVRALLSSPLIIV